MFVWLSIKYVIHSFIAALSGSAQQPGARYLTRKNTGCIAQCRLSSLVCLCPISACLIMLYIFWHYLSTWQTLQQLSKR